MLRLTIALVVCSITLVYGQEPCTNPNGKAGTCINLYSCPSLFGVLERQRTAPSEEGRNFLLKSRCRSKKPSDVFVCCNSDTGRTERPRGGNVPMLEPPACGRPSLANRILSGNDTNLDEYPWMALLYYVDKNGLVDHNCAGSLLNPRYVLTAAHCVKGDIETSVGPLKHIRLGEYDTLNDIDCVDDYCNKAPLDVGYEEVIAHEDYDPTNPHRYHDIALIRLDRDVPYNDFVRPVCLTLPTTPGGTLNPGDEVAVAGWGRTVYPKTNNIKQHVFLPIVEQQSCTDKFKNSRLRVNIRTTQLCAGGEFIRDSCDGDSGGPLMRISSKGSTYLEGVVSFGYGCGREGWPGVYTRVTEYLDWIKNNMRM